MMPIGPLMIEYRLIERMIALIAEEAQRIKQGHSPDNAFLRAAVDFIQTYADRLHHGKEEDILFRELAKKPLSAAHRTTMDELVQEHAQGRENTQKLAAAHMRFASGEQSAAAEIAERLDKLAKFYPKHIDKEDRHFFIPVMAYFSQAEQAAMLAECNDFDRQFIHGTYKNIVSAWKRK